MDLLKPELSPFPADALGVGGGKREAGVLDVLDSHTFHLCSFPGFKHRSGIRSPGQQGSVGGGKAHKDGEKLSKGEQRQ